MAQQIINTGEEPNDGTGESLRSAFNAVNENFSEIYAAGPVGSNVVISSNVISVIGTNNNLVLSGNGIGEVQFNSGITPTTNAVFDIGNPGEQFRTVYANLFVGDGSGLTNVAGRIGTTIRNGDSNVDISTQSGNVTISVSNTSNVAVFQRRNISFNANIIPSANAAYDIGTGNLRYKDLYLAGQTIYLGAAEFSANATSVTVTNPAGGTFVLQGAGEFTAYSNAAVESFLPTYTGGFVNLTGNITTSANIRAQSVRANTALIARDLTLSGNIHGSVSVSNIGNINSVTAASVNAATGNFSNLAVSNTLQSASVSVTGTITSANVNATNAAISNAVIGSITSSVLQANTALANTISAGSIDGSQISATGNITGSFFIGDGSQLTGLPESYSNVNVASYLLTNTANIAAGTFISNRLLSGNTLTLTANLANITLTGDTVDPVLQAGIQSNLRIVTQGVSTHQFEFDTNGKFKSPVSVEAINLLSSNVQTDVITPRDNLLVLVNSNAQVNGQFGISGNLSTSGNASAAFFIGNGSQLTGVIASDVEQLASLTVTGNIISGNIQSQTLTSSTIFATGNIVGSATSSIEGMNIGLSNAGDARFNNLTVLANTLLSGVTNTANIVTAGTISATGQVSAGSVSAAGNVLANNVIGVTTVSAASVVGNTISATGAISTAGNVVGAQFIGNGRQLTGIVSSYQNSNVEAFLPTYTGNLISMQGNLTTTANVNANNISSSNLLLTNRLATTGDALIGGNLFVNGNTVEINVTDLNVQDPIIGIGRGPNNEPLTANDGKARGSRLWYYTTQERQAFVGWDNANTRLLAAANVNISNDIVSVNSFGTFTTGNIVAQSLTSSGNIAISTTIRLNANGNVTGINSITANGVTANTASITTISATNLTATGNINVGQQLSVTGNVTAAQYSGSGAGLTFIPGANVQGSVALAESANIASTVTASNQPNVTGVGTLNSLTVAGNVVVDTNTLVVREDLNFIGIGGTPTNKLTVIDNSPPVLSRQEIAAFYSTAINGNQSSGINFGKDANNSASIGYLYVDNGSSENSLILGFPGDQSVLSINQNKTATFVGNVSIGGVQIDAVGAQITGTADINTLALTATGNVTGGNIVSLGAINANANITGNNVTAVNSVQANVILANSAVSAAGIVSTGNISAAGTVSAATVSATLLNAGNITATGNVVAASFFGNLVGNFTSPGSNTQVLINNNGIIGASSGLVFDFVGNTLSVGGAVSLLNNGNLTVSGAIQTDGNIAALGNISGNAILGSLVSVSGNVIGGNVNTAGIVSAAGNIIGGNVNSAAAITSSTITAVGNITGGNLITSGQLTVSSTANIFELSVSNSLTAGGNILGNNITSSNSITATGNISSGNVSTTGEITAQGNIVTSGSFVGNLFGNVVGSLSAPGSNTQLLINSDGQIGAASELTFDTVSNTLSLQGNVSAADTLSAANLIISSQASVTGNVTTGNISTGSLVLSGNVQSDINSIDNITTTANIFANNITAATSININGSLVATVDDATALAIALG
jgi:hypothetical protein